MVWKNEASKEGNFQFRQMRHSRRENFVMIRYCGKEKEIWQGWKAFWVGNLVRV